MLAKITKNGGKTLNWFSVDSEDTFNKILPTMPADWEYRNTKVSYSLNKQGYRTKEWDDINWSASTLMIGCSNTLGLGITEKDTACSILEKELGYPFINLGVVGSSNHLIFYNSMRLLENGIKPKSVILLFSDPSRYTHFNIKDDYIIPLGHWSLKDKDLSTYYYNYSNHLNCNIHGTMMALAAEALWKSRNVPTLAYSAYPNSLEDKFKILPERIDTAREINHPGVETNKIWADIIKKDLLSIYPAVYKL